jgi:hypothetical protein
MNKILICLIKSLSESPVSINETEIRVIEIESQFISNDFSKITQFTVSNILMINRGLDSTTRLWYVYTERKTLFYFILVNRNNNKIFLSKHMSKLTD